MSNQIEVWRVKTKIYGSVTLFLMIITLLGSLTGIMETGILYTIGISLFIAFMAALTFFSYWNYTRSKKEE